MRRMNPIIFGIAFAVLGAAYHAVRVVRVVLGLAEPHSIGSLGFPLTASIVIGATAIVAFLVGLAFGVVWNWLAAATKLTRATWVIAILERFRLNPDHSRMRRRSGRTRFA